MDTFNGANHSAAKIPSDHLKELRIQLPINHPMALQNSLSDVVQVHVQAQATLWPMTTLKKILIDHDRKHNHNTQFPLNPQ